MLDLPDSIALVPHSSSLERGGVFHAEHKVSRFTEVVVAIQLVVPRHVVGLVKQVIGIECQDRSRG